MRFFKRASLAAMNKLSGSLNVLSDVLQALNFSTWPTYNPFFAVSLSGGATVNASQGYVATNAYGYSSQGMSYSITFSIPAGAKSVFLDFTYVISYDQTISILENGSAGFWVASGTHGDTPVRLALTPGKTYAIKSTATTTLNGNWTMVKNLSVTYKP
jgi:hypothetical protein